MHSIKSSEFIAAVALVILLATSSTNGAAVCPAGSTLAGVDVSLANGIVDWDAVRTFGISYAFARVSDGTILDSKFETNYTGIMASGIIRGVYQLFDPEQDPVEQANLLVSEIGTPAQGDLPPVLDVENSSGQSPAVLINKIQAWMAIVEQSTGRTPIIYTGAAFWNFAINSSVFSTNLLWIDAWSVSCPTLPSAWQNWQFWQFGSTNSVPGISVSVDLDVFNGTMSDLLALTIPNNLAVTSTDDSGPGTLRQAILEANADTSLHQVNISFDIPEPGVQTIAPLTALPTITRPVTIDGYTQPEASSNSLANADNAALLIELSGTNLNSDSGLRFDANDCTVRGLVINGFLAQVLFESATNGVVEGNFLGTDVTGISTNTVVGANGVQIIGGAGHVIGGSTPASRNIISGNSSMAINAGTCTGLRVLGNFIGITADGLNVLPDGYGISLTDCSQTQIGGSTADDRNVIAGHSIGCWVSGGESNVFQGSLFGTDPSGTLRRTNDYGLVLHESAGNEVGGPEPGEGNLFSGNGTGIYLDGDGAINNIIAGNLIGPDITGTNFLGNDSYGVAIFGGAGNTVGGVTSGARNVIAGNLHGIAIDSGSNNIIQGNFIGTDASGTEGLGNEGYGIYVGLDAPGTLIGGTDPGAGNLISTNGYGGIYIGSAETIVQGNLIGTDVTGTNALFNGQAGIEISPSAPYTQIGGTNVAARNIITGNTGISIYSSTNTVQGNFLGIGSDGQTIVGTAGFGVTIDAASGGNLVGGDDAGAGNLISGWFDGVSIAGSNNIVQGNLIGTDSSGTLARGNSNIALTISGQDNLVGGLTSGARNLISANGTGIDLNGNAATWNEVQGNFVGTDITGDNALPNSTGLRIHDGGSGNLVGGMIPGAGNWIAYSEQWGISLIGDGVTNNAFLGNSIFGNGWSGIDLGEDGVTANDPGDPDEGENHLQNWPEIASARLVSSNLVVNYRVDSAVANSVYPLTAEFYLADANGQGRTLIYRDTYDTPQSFTNITFMPATPVQEGDPIVATATDANGNTSEFSMVATATVNHAPIVSNPIPDSPAPAAYGSLFNYQFPTNTFQDPDAGDLLSYSAVGMPPGIGFTPATRTFSGTPTNVGVFSVTVTAMDDGLPPLATNEMFDIVVAKAALVVTANNKSKLIGDANPVLDGSLVGVTNNDPISVTFTTTAETNSPAGDYPITPVFDDPANRLPEYSITTNLGTLTIEASNNPPMLTELIPNTNTSYGAAFIFTFATNTFTDPDAGQTLSYSAVGMPPGIGFTPATRTFRGTPTNAGVFSVTVMAMDDGLPPLATNEMFDIVVAKAALVVTANNKSKLIGDLNPVLDGSLVGVTNNDAITVTFTTTAETNSPLGDYPITPVFDDPANRLPEYSITTNLGTLTVAESNSPPVLTELIPNTNTTYGAAFSFTFATNTFADPDAGQTLTYTATNLPPGITFDGSSRTFSGAITTVSNYLVTVTATDDGTPPLSTNAIFSIVVDKALLTVSAYNTNRPYGLLNPALTGILVGVTNNDNITATFDTTAAVGSPPGDYPITPSLLDPDGRLVNYAVTNNQGMLTVNGVVLEFSLSDGSPSFCWPTNAASFNPEYTDSLTPPVDWQPVSSGVTTNDSTICFTTTPTAATPTRFYRLHLQ